MFGIFNVIVDDASDVSAWGPQKVDLSLPLPRQTHARFPFTCDCDCGALGHFLHLTFIPSIKTIQKKKSVMCSVKLSKHYYCDFLVACNAIFLKKTI